ncbi:MAG: hypothetical protein C0404_13160 [Verrucomicrobia bacterium]|nr:hypothetical protein [Verrucomicrobiota bacterium]
MKVQVIYPPAVWEGPRLCTKRVGQIGPRCVLTWEFCGSVFDILRFVLMFVEGYRGDWVMLGVAGASVNMPL